MINPSIPGWIDKFFIELKAKKKNPLEQDSYYNDLRSNGFLFGNVVDLNPENNFLSSEIVKVAFLDALFGLYSCHELPKGNFVSTCNLFFQELNPNRTSILEKILSKNSDSLILEKNIEERIFVNENMISKNFSYLVTNAFLFVDVLAFQRYIIEGLIPENYLKNIEETIISIITLSLKTKSKKSKNDEQLIQLFETSMRYIKVSDISVTNFESLDLAYFNFNLEKKYFIDLACFTFWSDRKMENNEIYFLHKLSEILQLHADFVYESISGTDDFIKKNIQKISIFNNSNPVKNFYTQTTQKVSTLILRNKKRFIKEISQSKELMVLLATSTKRDLDESEKKKVKSQLLDICKTVPSLTLFLIPGGSLLLPILIKFIPQLLPSAFNENLEEK